MKNKQKVIGSIVIACLALVFIVVGYMISKTSKQPLKSSDVFVDSGVECNDTRNITVYINGEIKKPGVYQLKDGSIVDDIIKIAGGFTENADNESLKIQLNLAQKLRDGEHIYVLSKDDVKNGMSPAASSISSPNSTKVNINTATKEELKTIPGIGDVTAQKIIDYREKKGGFKTIEDLKRVDRIGEKTFEKFKDKVDVR